MITAPQPIPYQGSKRKQVPIILGYIPSDTETLYEPFAGSAAVTIGAAASNSARRFSISDSLKPLTEIWTLIVEAPDLLSDEYSRIWEAQLADPRAYFDQVRLEFNQQRQPAQLLYLLARCVKNAIRFNSNGEFNQSPDNRRLGMKPALLRERVNQVHALLAQRAEVWCGDYLSALEDASPKDVVYMDPPYVGVSGVRDQRYHQQLDYERFVLALAKANSRQVSYLVSFDGRCGDKEYGPGLPDSLGLSKIDVHVGRSSQATLAGREEETVESLYLSPALMDRLSAHKVRMNPTADIRKHTKTQQLSLA